MNPLLTGLLSFCFAPLFALQTVGDVVLKAGFDSDAEGFVFSTDPFRGTSQPGYAFGVWLAAGGLSGGGLRVNLGGTFLAIKCALPALLEAGGGAIVTIASTAALRGHGRGPSYSASKGGVVALTRILAEQYGERGIRVNCICPGAIAGEGMGAYFASEAGGSQAARGNSLGRVGLAEELGGTAAYLLSEDASFVHGQILAVDGGASVR